MDYSVIQHGKCIRVSLSRRAEVALVKRDKPLTAVVHLIFGCMVAKRVWFREQVDAELTRVTENLNLNFDVVRYANCSLRNIDGGGEPESFPLGRDVSDFVPDLLVIDYKKKEFTGEFTYKRKLQSLTESLDEPGKLSGCAAASGVQQADQEFAR